MHLAGTVLWEGGGRATFVTGFDRCPSQFLEVNLSPSPFPGIYHVRAHARCDLTPSETEDDRQAGGAGWGPACNVDVCVGEGWDGRRRLKHWAVANLLCWRERKSGVV